MSPTPLLLLLLLSGTCCCCCPHSWTSFGRSCYAFIREPLTWNDAAALCMVLGGNLVEINSPSENAFLWNLLIGRRVAEAWIGINDIVQEGHWVLTSSGRALSYTNWDSREPNNLGGNENGGEMWRGGKWNDLAIPRQLPSICERRSFIKVKG